MKIICAPDSFKETLSAHQAAGAMARGVARAAEELNLQITADVCPVADGGEGTMDALMETMGGELRACEALNPLGQPISAEFAILHRPRPHILQNESTSTASGRVAVVELARASGLALIPRPLRNPMNTTTFGTGQLIRSAFEAGCENVIVCIGGSATIDGGAGMAQALGAQFFDGHGGLIEKPMTGGMLSSIAHVIPPASHRAICVACDVINPLCGPDGAAPVYGPQKGATPEQVRLLDDALATFASVVGGDPNRPGAGAAGGAGFGLAALCSAKLVRGVDLVLQAIGFAQRCRGATLVLTGEGRLDRQSLHDKAVMGVARAAANAGVPTIAIVGSIGAGAEDCLESRSGFLRRYVSLADRFGMDRAWRDPVELVEQLAQEVTRDVLWRA